MNRAYLIRYKVDGKKRSERISAPDALTAERQWKHYRAAIGFTNFEIEGLGK